MMKFFDWLEVRYLNNIPDWAILATASIILLGVFVIFIVKWVRAVMSCPRCGLGIVLASTDEGKQVDRWICASSCGWEQQKMFN